jgi:spore germination protein GerM
VNLQRALVVGALTAVTASLTWLLFVGLPRWSVSRRATPPAPAATPARPDAVRKIKARLFYVGDDGRQLTSVEQDIAYGESTVEQAKAIVTAQIAPVAEPLVSAIPPGTALRALFITPKGEAYVDLSPELVSAHPGGSTNEMLTVNTIVQALTVNLPSVTSVQVLVDGKEVETLAGHVDLRSPLKAASH